MQKFRNSPITILTFLILISFCVIVIFPSYDQYHIDNDNRMKDSISVVQFLRGGNYKSKHFDKNFHRILQKGFPDWERRVEYQKKEQELYKSAQKKLKMNPLGISSSKENLEKVLSPEERDAIAYFQGTGFYQYYQKIENRFAQN